MSHNVETMAYAGETPWHGLGKQVHDDLTPEQFLEEAGLNWTVSVRPSMFKTKDGQYKHNGSYTLIRDSDDTALTDGFKENWFPTQNAEMAGFFHDFVMNNQIKIETGGSLQDGKIVWFLGKTTREFALKFNNGEDLIENFLLFSLYHQFGRASDIRNTDVRVVCNNTFSQAHSKDATHNVRFDHRKVFDAEEAKLTLEQSYAAQSEYKKKAEYLASKRVRGTDVMEYFQDVFPSLGKKEYSRNANLCKMLLETQPGAELGEGTWWQPFNAVTYLSDHVLGNDRGDRLTQSWYGKVRDTKTKALDLALKYAAL